jgi:2-haloacid dehalogenase
MEMERELSGTDIAHLKAILFDLFGTTLDWLSGIRTRGRELEAKNGIKADWTELAKQWRARYPQAIAPVREGRREWADFTTLHREELDKIAGQFGLQEVSEADRDWLTEGWSLLPPWPEVRSGISRLRKQFIVGPLSNASLRQQVDLARSGGLTWDVLLAADMFGTYKPAPGIYQGAVRLLQLRPEEVMLVAAHNQDLEHASQHGIKTCFVRRETEDAQPASCVDCVVDDFEHLARLLGVA